MLDRQILPMITQGKCYIPSVLQLYAHIFTYLLIYFRFLPWHRQFLLEFESAMQTIDPSVTLP